MIIVTMVGIEPTTPILMDQRYYQLSYIAPFHFSRLPNLDYYAAMRV